MSGSAIPGGGIVLLDGAIFGAGAPAGDSVQLNRLSGNTPFDIYSDGSGSLNTVRGNSCHTTNLGGCLTPSRRAPDPRHQRAGGR